MNLNLSLRKTSQALKDLYNIQISHQQIANYCKTAAICVKPFVNNYDYGAGNILAADETYIKIRGLKSYIWFIMDAAKRSIIGYRVSDNRSVGPCIMAMRMAFQHWKSPSKDLLSAIFKVHLSLFLLAHFFIDYLTLPKSIPETEYSKNALPGQ